MKEKYRTIIDGLFLVDNVIGFNYTFRCEDPNIGFNVVLIDDNIPLDDYKTLLFKTYTSIKPIVVPIKKVYPQLSLKKVIEMIFEIADSIEENHHEMDMEWRDVALTMVGVLNRSQKDLKKMGKRIKKNKKVDMIELSSTLGTLTNLLVNSNLGTDTVSDMEILSRKKENVTVH